MFVFIRLLVVESIQPASTFTEPSLLIRTSRWIRRLRAPGFMRNREKFLDPRVSATTPSRWTITPLFYSQSIDLPVLRGRRHVDGAPERLQTRKLWNKFVFQALRFGDGPDKRPERELHCIFCSGSSRRLVHRGTPLSHLFGLVTWTCDHQRV